VSEVAGASNGVVAGGSVPKVEENPHGEGIGEGNGEGVCDATAENDNVTDGKAGESGNSIENDKNDGDKASDGGRENDSSADDTHKNDCVAEEINVADLTQKNIAEAALGDAKETAEQSVNPANTNANNVVSDTMNDDLSVSRLGSQNDADSGQDSPCSREDTESVVSMYNIIKRVERKGGNRKRDRDRDRRRRGEMRDSNLSITTLNDIRGGKVDLECTDCEKDALLSTVIAANGLRGLDGTAGK
jgi:hypothetical protein